MGKQRGSKLSRSKTAAKQRATGKPFAPGDPRINRKGRPSNGDTCADYLKAHLTKDEWALQVRKLCRKANIRALELYAAYLWGKPRQTLELEHSGYIDPIQSITHAERQVYISAMIGRFHADGG